MLATNRRRAAMIRPVLSSIPSSSPESLRVLATCRVAAKLSCGRRYHCYHHYHYLRADPTTTAAISRKTLSPTTTTGSTIPSRQLSAQSNRRNMTTTTTTTTTTSAKTQPAAAATTVTAPWLQNLIAAYPSEKPPPVLYAWTTANLAPPDADPAAVVGDGKVRRPAAEEETAATRRTRSRERIHILGIGNMGRLYAITLARPRRRMKRKGERSGAAAKEKQGKEEETEEEEVVPPPPITLVVHRRELLEHWARSPGVELKRNDNNGDDDVVRSGDDGDTVNANFDVEWWTEERPAYGPVVEVGGNGSCDSGGGGIIHNLIIATKASDAVPEADRLRRYLGPESTVAFVQNGMSKLWPPLGEVFLRERFSSSSSSSSSPPSSSSSSSSVSSSSSPNWLACVTTHGVLSLGPFRSLHASPAHAVVGPVLLNRHLLVGTGRGRGGRGGEAGASAHGKENENGIGEEESRPEEYLIEQLATAPGLDGRRMARGELWVSQVEKLAVNAVVNPLTAVLRCKNGGLLLPPERTEEGKGGTQGGGGGGVDPLPAIIDALIRETSRTLQALVADESTGGILADYQPDDDGGSGDATTPATHKDADNNVSSHNNEDDDYKNLQATRAALTSRLAFAPLRTMVLGVLARVGENTSSMLQDVRGGKRTEVRDLNGWLVDTAGIMNASSSSTTTTTTSSSASTTTTAMAPEAVVMLRLPAHEKVIELVERQGTDQPGGRGMSREELGREFEGIV